MSRQTTLRWKGRTLEALFAQLPTEHRRRAERLYGQLIARAARGTMAVEDGVRRARRLEMEGLEAIPSGEDGTPDHAITGAQRGGLLPHFEKRGHERGLAEPELAQEVERGSARVLDGAGVGHAEGQKGGTR